MRNSVDIDKPAVFVHIELEFVAGRKRENPEKNPRSKARTNNKFDPHETASTGIKPWSQRRDRGERLSTAPPVTPSHQGMVA